MEHIYNIKYINADEKNTSILNIFDLQYRKIKHAQNLSINIDFNLIDENKYKKIIRKFKRKITKKKNHLKNIDIYVLNFNKDNAKHIDFMYAVEAILHLDKKEMYSFIYDTVCNYLDNCFINGNLCEFENDRCGEKRGTSCKVGCCRHFKHKRIGPLLPNDKLTVCEYLKDKKCSVKCISCKLFTCNYIHKKGVIFKLKDIFLIDTFFNPIQKYFIKCKVFTPKEEILKLLLIFSF